MKYIGAFFLGLLVVFILGVTFVPSMRAGFNEYVFGMNRIDEEINYENRKAVEDTARSMIANYEFAKNEYDSYKNYCNEPVDKDRCQRALDSKSSANKTVSTYNNYILKNKYLWKGNLPSDIFYELTLVE